MEQHNLKQVVFQLPPDMKNNIKHKQMTKERRAASEPNWMIIKISTKSKSPPITV